MFQCPRCGRRWERENAKANQGLCYRGCDAHLVDLELEAGPHFNHLDALELDGKGPWVGLRGAVAAVSPGGRLVVERQRYTDPLVLDKAISIHRAAGGSGEAFLQTEEGLALKVCPADHGTRVEIHNLVFFRGRPRPLEPLIRVESGELFLKGCRLDCCSSPGILVSGGARLLLEDCTVLRPGSYGVQLEEGATLLMRGCAFDGRPGDIWTADVDIVPLPEVDPTLTQPGPELPPAAEAPDAPEVPKAPGRGILDFMNEGQDEEPVAPAPPLDVALEPPADAVVVMEYARQEQQGAVVALGASFMELQDSSFYGHDVAIALHEAVAQLQQLEFHSCGLALKCTQSKVKLLSCRFHCDLGNAIHSYTSRLSEVKDCHFLQGKRQVQLVGGELFLHTCRFEDAAELCVSVQSSGRASITQSEVLSSKRHGWVSTTGGRLLVEDSRLSHCAGVAMLAHGNSRLELRQVQVEDCALGMCGLSLSQVDVDGLSVVRSLGSAVLGGKQMTGRLHHLTVRESGADQVVLSDAASPGLDAAQWELEAGTHAGLRLERAARLTLHGLRASGHGGATILVGEQAQLELEDAQLYQGRGDGLLIGPKAEVALRQCRIDHMSGCGARLFGTASFTANRSKWGACGHGALFADGAAQLELHECQLEGGLHPAVTVVSAVTAQPHALPGQSGGGSSTQVSFTGCQLRGGEAEGLLVMGTVEAKCKECEVGSSTASALRMWGPAKVEILAGRVDVAPQAPVVVGRLADFHVDGTQWSGPYPLAVLRRGARGFFASPLWPKKGAALWPPMAWRPTWQVPW